MPASLRCLVKLLRWDRRYLTCRAEGGFAGASDESRAPEFRAGFEARLAELETALGKHGGPFFLGCGFVCHRGVHNALRCSLLVNGDRRQHRC